METWNSTLMRLSSFSFTLTTQVSFIWTTDLHLFSMEFLYWQYVFYSHHETVGYSIQAMHWYKQWITMGIEQKYLSTRMHSSRMHTARTLTISGGCTCPRGCACPGGVPAQGGTCPGGCTCPGGYLPKAGVPARGVPSGLPPWTEFLTHASENITLPQTSFVGGN